MAGIVIGAALWGAALTGVSYAADPTAADLEAVVRALGFLESLQRHGAVDTAVAYAPNTPAMRAQAAQVAERLSAMPGPNKSAIHATPISVEALAQGNDAFDVLYLMPGAAAESAPVLEAARKRRIVTISNDPACQESKSCVLTIRTGRGVEIVLQTALADAVGARFSAVFSMMVKRQ